MSKSSEAAPDARTPLLGQRDAKNAADPGALSERHPSSVIGELEREQEQQLAREEDMENLSRKSQWIVLAVASGGCAAFNGVFAKL